MTVQHPRKRAGISRRNSCCPAPISAVRRGGYRCIEFGVRRVVQLLAEAGFHPVWSCQGHCGAARPTWLSFGGSPFDRPCVSWSKPHVICTAGRDSSVLAGFLAEHIIGSFSVYAVRVWPGATYRAMKRAAPPGRTRWFLLAFDGTDKRGCVRLRRATT